MPRRRFIELVAALPVIPALAATGCAPSPAPDTPLPNHDEPDPAPFTDGVICGDPHPDGAVIWTRVDNARDRVGVVWSVATDPSMATIVVGGVTVADPAADGAVAVRVSGLRPDRWYWYRFEAAGVASRVGRLRTSPSPDADVDHLRFCFASCQQLNDSWFVAHRAAADEPDVDFFMHLGDYVYVDDDNTLTLDDYRATYRRWRKEPLLRDWHARQPLVVTWDDGEFYNGVHRGGPPERLAAARQAFYEHMPVVNPDDGPIYRRVDWGALCRLHLLDGRRYRDPSIDSIDRVGEDGWLANSPLRQAMGAEQAAWLHDGLVDNGGRRWNIIGNSTPVGPWRLLSTEFLRPFADAVGSALPPDSGLYLPSETWDDFAAQRRDVLADIAAVSPTPVMFATAHTHIANASELAGPRHIGAAAYDIVAPSMTADPDPKRSYLSGLPTSLASDVLRFAERWLMSQNPQWRYVNLEEQGYVVIDITPDEIDVAFRMIDTFDPDGEPWTAAAFRIDSTGSRLEMRPADRRTGTARR